MADTLKASKEGLELIDRARKRKGWNKIEASEWWRTAQSSRATLKRFWKGEPISREAFIGICQAVGEDWRKVAEPSLVECKSFLLPKNLPAIKNWVEGSRSKELEKLEATILDSETKSITITAVCVVGLAGIGKTTLANQLIRKLQRKNAPFTASSWQSLRSITGRLPRFDSVIDSVLLELSNGEIHPLITILDDYRQKTERLIEVLKNKECLLVFDNVETVLKTKQAKRAGFFLEECTEYAWLFEQVSNLEHKSKVIFTSRETLTAIPGVEFKLGGLDKKSAIQLLKSFKLIASSDNLEKLVNKYDGHPKALEVVSALILENEFQGCVFKFLEDRKWLLVNTLDELLDQVIERLSDEELQCLSRISVYETTEYRLQSNSIVAQLPQINERDVKENIIEALKRRQLLDFDSSKASYQMHPLVQEKASSLLGNESRIVSHRQAYQYFRNIAQPATNWDAFDDIKPLIRAHYHACQANDWDEAAQVFLEMYPFLRQHGYFDLIIDLCSELLPQDWESSQLIKSSKLHADILCCLGVNLEALSQRQLANEYLEQCLKISRLIKDPKREANALSYIGLNYESMGEYQKAINYLSQSISVIKEHGVNDYKTEYRALSQSGLAYIALGQFHLAIDFFNRSLEFARQSKYKQGEAVALGNLGDVYTKVQEYDLAIQYSREYLDFANKTDNPKSRNYALIILAQAYNEAAKAHGLNNYYQDAINLSQECLRVAREINHKITEAKALFNLGVTYRGLQDNQNSASCFIKAIDIHRKSNDRIAEARCLHQLGLTYRNMNHSERCILYFQESLEIFKELSNLSSEATVLSEIVETNFIAKTLPTETIQEYLDRAEQICMELQLPMLNHVQAIKAQLNKQ